MAQTKPKAGQFYGVSGNGTDGQFLQTDGAGGMDWADTTVAPTLTSIDYPGIATAADPAGGESIIINGTGFQTGITCTIGGTSATTAFNSATQITITSPAKAAGQYTVAVTNTDGGNGSQANFIQYSGVPVWSTASGSLGSVEEGASASFQVTATEGSDTIEYAVTSGSLPSGLSLNTNTGAITGTAPSVAADTTSTFSITATDDENQTSSARSFSITVTAILPSAQFNTVLYNGTGAVQNIQGLSFKPDFVWLKCRDNSRDHRDFDTVRGAENGLYPNLSNGQFTGGNLTSFNSDGFTLGSSSGTNHSGQTFVSWNLKAGGAPTATNSAGAGNAPTLGSVMIDGSASTATLAGTNPITKISANTTLGFSVVELSKTNTNSETFAHGLGIVPEMIILKRTASTDDWYVYHKDLGNTVRIQLNSTSAKVTGTGVWDSTTPTSSVFSLQNQAGGAHVAYCFASQAGFSKVGSFTGNGTSSKIIETGFKVGWVLIKNTDATYRWYMLDDKRGGSSRLFANDAGAENNNQETVKFLENGFEITTSDAEVNQSGSLMIYLAFAADPSTTTPSLANSFNAVENTSPTTNQAIAAGFTPDMVWIKGSNIGSGNPTAWGQYDTVRGSGLVLQSDNSDAQYDYSGHPSGDLAMQFTSTGYNTPPVVNGNINNASDDYINYFWKAGGLASINTDGTITSIVSANQAAGFSIVRYTAAASSTVGHGLGGVPELLITKMTDATANWAVYHADLGINKTLQLDTTGAEIAVNNYWGTSAPTSTVYGLSTNSGHYNAYGQQIAYCFRSITGFSSIGTYTASGSAGSPTITTGFQPGFVMIKNVDRSQEWIIIDSVRGLNKSLQPDSTAAEGVNGNIITTNATSFTIDVNGGGINYASGDTMIYAAFKIN